MLGTTASVEPTVGEIARRAGKPTHKVAYVIRSRRIRPARVAGNLRIFAEEDVRRIIAELHAIDSARQEANATAAARSRLAENNDVCAEEGNACG